ncbi:hypothetical protein [Paracoccus subflavus]|nr:hypothetical protein [Paracoccus subflavus]
MAEVFPPALRSDPGFAAELAAALSGLVRNGTRAMVAERMG